MELSQILLFAFIVMCAYFIEGLIGFGGTIMAIPLASAVIGLKLTIPVLTIVVFIASIIIAIRDVAFIDKKQFLKITIPMVLGLPIGIWLFETIPERPLKLALGIFMVIIGIKGVYNLRRKNINNDEIAVEYENGNNSDTLISEEQIILKSKLMKAFEYTTIFCGGIVHGAFTCGDHL
ncbi:sulfite exporter TauE/SafE family protein [Paraclostridium bifermentans]|uniref:Probable membrane transporter protein n=1 Tax=Paraclostridium bifermentans TaxID=1490 RepID=A0ABY8R6C5_PARBF|nr:sulfite exporter TauE/SafE family protein [Paraclostridium bifermentans]